MRWAVIAIEAVFLAILMNAPLAAMAVSERATLVGAFVAFTIFAVLYLIPASWRREYREALKASRER